MKYLLPILVAVMFTGCADVLVKSALIEASPYIVKAAINVYDNTRNHEVN